MSERLRPGVHVRTADPLLACKWYPDRIRELRRAGATGVIFPEVDILGVHWVRHEDGTEAPYDGNELTPEEQ